MKRTMKKMLSFGLVAAMSLTMLAGCFFQAEDGIRDECG